MRNLLNNPRFPRGTRGVREPGTGLRSCPEVAGSNPAPATNVMSQDIGDSRTHVSWVRLLSFRGGAGGSLGGSGGLVVAVGVEDQFAEDLAGGGVDDGDVEVLDEQVRYGPIRDG